MSNDSPGGDVRRVLIVCKEGREPKSRGLIDAGSTMVANFDQALEKLRGEQYDLVIVEDSEFLSLGRAALAEQSSVILETIAQGVGILDLEGKLVWGNRQLMDLPEDIPQRLQSRCVELFEREIASGSANGVSRRFNLQSGDGRHFEVTASAVVDGDERFRQIAVVLWDTTSGRRLQEKLNAIDQAGREVVRLESDRVDKLTIPDRLALLEEKIISYTRDVLGFDKFCIRLLDKKTNRLELVLCSGLTERGREMDIFASPEGNGICGYVASTGRSYICPDVSRDRRYIEGISEAGSSLTVPLFLRDQVVGVFNVEAEDIGRFGEEERQFAEIFGRYVAVALHMLDLLVVERHKATGQLASDVSTEIAGPLNDILSDATTLMEEYIGRDDLRGRLQSIRESVGKIRSVVKGIGQAPNGLLDHRRSEPVKDPVICEKHILVIDDEPIIRETITDILSGKGAEVDTARDGNEAVAMIDQHRYDLILSDIKMPHKSGYEIFAAAKEAAADVPVVFMTGFGYDPNHNIIRARQEGLSGVLYKPFKVNDFLSLIRDVLRG